MADSQPPRLDTDGLPIPAESCTCGFGRRIPRSFALPECKGLDAADRLLYGLVPLTACTRIPVHRSRAHPRTAVGGLYAREDRTDSTDPRSVAHMRVHRVGRCLFHPPSSWSRGSCALEGLRLRLRGMPLFFTGFFTAQRSMQSSSKNASHHY